MTVTTATRRELEEISRDLRVAGVIWEAAGCPLDGPEAEAREAVYARLKAWNEAREQGRF